MCGRYAFFSSREATRRLFGDAEFPPVTPHYNLAPTDFVPVVRLDRAGTPRLTLVRWGLVPHWAQDVSIGNRLINARAETLDSRRAFREAFRRRRCLVLATGFYEWARTDAGRIPHFIRRADGAPFAMAGLWERWRAHAEDEWLDTCTVITTDANTLVGTLHHRMPAIIDPTHFALWLDREHFDAEELRALLAPWPDDGFVAHPVSADVNDPRHDGPGLVIEASAR